MSADELYHWGILGMKWGVRRFQNEDGSLTPEGRARYLKNPDHELKGDNIGKKELSRDGRKMVVKNIKEKYGNLEAVVMANKKCKEELNNILNNKKLKEAIDDEATKYGIRPLDPWSQKYINVVFGQYWKMLTDYVYRESDDVNYSYFAGMIGMTPFQYDKYVKDFVNKIGGDVEAQKMLTELDNFRRDAATALIDAIEDELREYGIYDDMIQTHINSTTLKMTPDGTVTSQRFYWEDGAVDQVLNKEIGTVDNLAFFNQYKKLEI